MNLDKRKMRGVQEYTISVLTKNKEFAVPEIIFGLAELVGRLVAKQTGGTTIQKKEILDAAIEHMVKTCRVGCGEEAEPSRIITLN